MIEALISVYRQAGLIGLLQRVAWRGYAATLRRAMPFGDPLYFGGIRGGNVGRRGDAIVMAALRYDPFRATPAYEQGLLTALKSHVRSQDRVVVVGTGHGITVVQAALSASSGHVVAYEGDPEGCLATNRTTIANGVQDRVTLHQAIVARGDHVYGLDRKATIVAPDELPDCDVLELDCEGAEAVILDGLTIRPRVIVVETHGCFGAPTDDVQQKLSRLGYAVQDTGWAEPDSRVECEANDIRVLVATKL